MALRLSSGPGEVAAFSCNWRLTYLGANQETEQSSTAGKLGKRWQTKTWQATDARDGREVPC